MFGGNDSKRHDKAVSARENGHAGGIILKRGEAEGDRAVLAIRGVEDADNKEDAVDA